MMSLINTKKILFFCLCFVLLLNWYVLKGNIRQHSIAFPCTLRRSVHFLYRSDLRPSGVSGTGGVSVITLPVPEDEADQNSGGESNGTERISLVSFFLDVKLPRTLYEKPNIFNPQRRDVLTVTPWLAPIVWTGTYNRDLLNVQFHQIEVRVGITVFAIKKYVMFLKKFIESAEKFFMVGHKVNYYVFTDRVREITNYTLGEGRNMVILEVPAYERWQDVTMRRMEMIRNFSAKRFVNEVDYLACVDVDMEFLDHVGVEILSNVFGALHPGFFEQPRKEFTYERRPQSSAYIPFEAGDFYYAGGFFGGVIEEVFNLTNYCHKAMMADKQQNVEALWHDESYLNKYFLLHKPTKILSPEYIWNNYYGSPAVVKTKRFLVVDKKYEEVRSEPGNSKNGLWYKN